MIIITYRDLIVEEYVTDNNMFQTIERVSSLDRINKKLKEYEMIWLNEKILRPNIHKYLSDINIFNRELFNTV